MDISEGCQATLGESSPLDSNRRLIQVTSRGYSDGVKLADLISEVSPIDIDSQAGQISLPFSNP